MPSRELLPILMRLNAAVGYLNLGMPQDAWNELEAIEAKDRAPARRTSFSPLLRPLRPRAIRTPERVPAQPATALQAGPSLSPHRRRGNLTPATPVASPTLHNKATPSTMQSGLFKNLQQK